MQIGAETVGEVYTNREVKNTRVKHMVWVDVRCEHHIVVVWADVHLLLVIQGQV